MELRVHLAIEIDRSGGGLSSSTPVDVQIIYCGGKWSGQCQEPPVSASVCDTLEEALLAVAKEIRKDWEGGGISNNEEGIAKNGLRIADCGFAIWDCGMIPHFTSRIS